MSELLLLLEATNKASALNLVQLMRIFRVHGRVDSLHVSDQAIVAKAGDETFTFA